MPGAALACVLAGAAGNAHAGARECVRTRGCIFPARTGEPTDDSMSTDTLKAALRKHMTAAGVYSGETVHGLKRGRVQLELASGRSEAELR